MTNREKIEAFIQGNKLSDIKVSAIDRYRVGKSDYFRNTKMFLNTEAVAYNRGKEKVLANDLQMWYSALALVMCKDNGYDQEVVLDIINQVLYKCKWLLDNYKDKNDWLKVVAKETGIYFYDDEKEFDRAA